MFPFSHYSKQTKSKKQTLKSNNVIMFLNKRDLKESREKWKMQTWFFEKKSKI